MRIILRVAFAMLLIVGLVAAHTEDAIEYKGAALAPDQGLVVLRVVRRMSSNGLNKAISRGDTTFTAILKDWDAKNKVLVKDCDKIKAFVLPAGRWYVEQMRTANDRDLPIIAKRAQSFEVKAGMINYAGVYTVDFVTDQDGRMGSSVNVEFAEDALKEASDAFPDAFKTLTLMYCPAGRLCKSPSEFQ